MVNDSPLHELLWKESRAVASACRAHPFVVGLERGTLPREAYQRYVAQDAFFLRAFLRAYGVALARTRDERQAAVVHGLIGGVLEELRLHRSYAMSVGIDLAAVTPHPATSAYTDFLLRTAWSEDLGMTLAAMTPCMRLYAYLGASLAPALHDEHPYGDWIRTYSSDGFESLARCLEGLLDTVASDTPAIRAAYHYAMECEQRFFDAPVEGST